MTLDEAAKRPKGEAVVLYCEPLTSLRQGYAPAGNKGDAAPSVFPTCWVVAGSEA